MGSWIHQNLVATEEGTTLVATFVVPPPARAL